MDEFMKIRARFIAAYKEEAQMRIELRGPDFVPFYLLLYNLPKFFATACP